jgi:hypothetical protein
MASETFVFMVLGFELRASHFLGSTLPREPCLQPLFALVIFQIESHIFAQGRPQD